MGRIIDFIDGPEDLKELPLKELPALAQDIREMIINTVSVTGGHLASNLGVVELTIALHYLFDAPKDKIIWDVGHQAYAHKILTGRRALFHSLRQYGGIAGFPRRDESPYDCFGTGHGGTSISAALAMAEARDLKGEDYKVVAIIGDGSISAGMALEGLNHAGDLKKDLIVVLNDNEMSISHTVGALAAYLNRIITWKFYNKMRKDIAGIIGTIPSIGNPMVKAVGRVEEAIKGIIVPGRLFEELGFKYVGPLNGHRINRLIYTLENVKKLKGPILLHVITKKGKGYEPAEAKTPVFHGASPFDVKTGNFLKKNSPPTYTTIFGQTLVKLAKSDERVVAITAAMEEGTGLNIFAQHFPGKFYDVGMAEQHGVTFAAGLAASGLRPFAAIYSTFLQRAYDQIVHDVCLQNLPVTFAIDRAGIVGEDGATHNGVFDLSYLRPIPNITVMAPKDENELQHMLRTALEIEGPSAIRYPRGSGVGVKLDDEPRPLPVGQAELLVEGKDLALLAIGNTVYPALEASRLLKRCGIGAAVINMRFLKPIDKAMIKKACFKIGALITVEENQLQGGFGSAVLEYIEEEKLCGVRVQRIGLPDSFIEHGHPSMLREKYCLDARGIASSVKLFFQGFAAENARTL